MKVYSKILTIVLLIVVIAFTVYNVKAQGKIYKIGQRGPAGGWIFYDKGSYADGWRYLEAAPEDQSESAEWGLYAYSFPGAKGTAIGTGKIITQTIVSISAEAGIAARLCTAYRAGGKSDWFLPSKDELNLMYTNLKKNGVGGFSASAYWSSTEYNEYYAWNQYFDFGEQIGKNHKYDKIRVRAVRSF